MIRNQTRPNMIYLTGLENHILLYTKLMHLLIAPPSLHTSKSHTKGKNPTKFTHRLNLIDGKVLVIKFEGLSFVQSSLKLTSPMLISPRMKLYMISMWFAYDKYCAI